VIVSDAAGKHNKNLPAIGVLPTIPRTRKLVDRTGGDAAVGERRSGPHRARRQRLRQQLLRHPNFRQKTSVLSPGLLPLSHLRVPQDPLGTNLHFLVFLPWIDSIYIYIYIKIYYYSY